MLEGVSWMSVLSVSQSMSMRIGGSEMYAGYHPCNASRDREVEQDESPFDEVLGLDRSHCIILQW